MKSFGDEWTQLLRAYVRVFELGRIYIHTYIYIVYTHIGRNGLDMTGRQG